MGRHERIALLLLPALVASYASLGQHPQGHRVSTASEACRAQLGHATGGAFMTCVVDELLALKQAAQANGTKEYFPVVRHSVDPWAPAPDQRGVCGSEQSDLLKDLLRNYSCVRHCLNPMRTAGSRRCRLASLPPHAVSRSLSCEQDVDDGGSQPLRSMTWEYEPPDPCGSLDDSSPPPPPFVYKQGFLPAGNDLAVVTDAVLTEEEAQEACLAHKSCAGFTFSAPRRGSRVRHQMHFKSEANGHNPSPEWHTFKRRTRSLDCRRGKRPPPPSKLRLQVDVLRESPPVYIVHDFATEKECEHMMNQTIPHMAPSVVYGGGQAGQSSSYRSSYSVNMYPDWDDESNVITRMVRRKFAFAREVAEYEALVEGEGQEPLNSVYYKNFDDQYRPHCDGQCHGGRYRKGERIATSLTYCAIADKGGYTMFSRTGLKVVPRRRQMLFFGYKLVRGLHAVRYLHARTAAHPSLALTCACVRACVLAAAASFGGRRADDGQGPHRAHRLPHP